MAPAPVVPEKNSSVAVYREICENNKYIITANSLRLLANKLTHSVQEQVGGVELRGMRQCLRP